MLDAEWSASVVNQNLTKAQLTKEVSDVFYRILTLQEKKKVIEYISKLYSSFTDKASLRLKKEKLIFWRNRLQKFRMNRQKHS